MPKRGVCHVPNAATERVLNVIASFTEEEFAPMDVRRLVPDLPWTTVNNILSLRARLGILLRVRHGRYRKGGTRLPLKSIPSAMAAQALWTVLFTDPERRPRLGTEIAADAESLVGRPDYDGCDTFLRILLSWHRSGHVERTGPCGQYRYLLREGVSERPVYRH